MREKYLRSKRVVVVLPRELGLDVATRVQRLASLDHVEVLGVNVVMLGLVEILLGHEHTLYSKERYQSSCLADLPSKKKKKKKKREK